MALLNQYEIEKYINIAAERGRLRVIWEDEEKPRTDGKTVWLPRIHSKTTAEQARRLMWFVTHEAEHNIYTDFSLMKEKNLDVTKSELAGLFNQLEDDNIDYLNSQQFQGDKELCSEQVSQMLPELLEKAKEAKAKGRDKEIGQDKWDHIMAMMAFESDYRSDYCYGTSHLVDGFKDLINNKKDGMVEKLLSGPYKEKLRELRKDTSLGRSRKTYELAKQIFEEVLNGDAKAEEERLKELAEQAGDGEEGDGEGSKNGKGKRAGVPDGGKKGSGKSGDAGSEYNKDMIEVDYSEWSSDPAEFIEHNDVGGGEKISYSERDLQRTGTYVPCPLRDTAVIDYERGTSNYSKIRPQDNRGGEGHFGRSYDEKYARLATTVSDGFANRVRMLLQIRSKGKTQYGTKRGVIHPANLYRTTIKDAPGYNERVFKKHIVSDVLNTCVQILVDCSGSMMGEKYAHAIVSAIHLSEVLGNTLHMPVEILGFSEMEGKNVIFMFRSFDTKVLSKDKLLKRMMHAGMYANQNADGDAVLFGYHRIISRREKRKVMIVLSDGSPAGDRPGDLPAFTKEVVEAIEKGKRVEIIGIGIQDTNVTKFYTSNEVIREPEEIEPALLKLIQRRIV